MDRVRAGPAIELEHPIAGSKREVELAPHRRAHTLADRAGGERGVVVGGEAIEGRGDAHASTSCALASSDWRARRAVARWVAASPGCCGPSRNAAISLRSQVSACL